MKKRHDTREGAEEQQDKPGRGSAPEQNTGKGTPQTRTPGQAEGERDPDENRR